MARRLLLVLVLAVAGIVAETSVAGAGWDNEPRLITLTATNTNTHTLLRALLDVGARNYVIGPDVPNDYVRAIAIVDVPYGTVLKSLAKWWRLNCNFEDSFCTVVRSSSEPNDISLPSVVPDSDKDKNTYYLVRNAGKSRASRSSEPERVNLGPRREPVNEALAQYAELVAKLVTPEMLDDLADLLRLQVDQNPDLRDRLMKEQIGLARFRPIGVESRELIAGLAEDLSTSMIKAGFNLVERAQLDKACEELRLQDTALIDPATAAKLGQMTGCGVIVVGSICYRGDRVVVNARLVETATGRALAADRVQVWK